MAVAQAVRPTQPSTRSTRSTRGTKNAANGLSKKTNVERGVHQTRPPTRRTTPGTNEPRRATSTRVSESVPSSNRKRLSTRPRTTRPESEVTKNRQRLGKNDNLIDRFVKHIVKPTEAADVEETTSSEPLPRRSEVYAQRREEKRNISVVQFIALMFFAVVASVFAFGLLREDPTAQQAQPDKLPAETEVIREERGTTSTNTGILRGH
ncbi:hypothetical protein CHH72_17135 [Shouchella clausii]|uniref:Uncharacterized protein n=1 Tax=Shouchella clausii TaxID=79880 RepID=A0A268NX97_SHOCL|nr:hypothetical protein CHH72_17135 [Shouchella clausii]